MKRIIIFFLLSMVLKAAYAVSAYPGFVNYRQPDGTFVKIRLMGDEHFHWAVTEDGYTLLANSKGFMTLAMPDKVGNLVASEHVITDKAHRSQALLNAMQQVKPHAKFTPAQLDVIREKSKSASMAISASNAETTSTTVQAPIVGKRKHLVILMDFQDVKFQKTKQDFHRLFNEIGYKEGGNYGSVHDFYYENSFGQLDLEFDVVGVYTATQKMTYYGNNEDNLLYLGREALTAASKDCDLSDYDADNDGKLDGVHIIFAGHGEEGGAGSDHIWSRAISWTNHSSIITISGKSMHIFSCSPELAGSSGTEQSKIGVHCHEIGHVLGASDYYDTNNATEGEYSGTANWDLMAKGSWNGNGGTPAHFNPYCKIYDFQWSDVMDGNKAQSVTLKAKTKNHFVRIDTKTKNEYFLLEYRHQTGFDSGLQGHGLIIYRASTPGSYDGINAGHRQGFYPLCANSDYALPTEDPITYGGPWDGTAPFPGKFGVTSLTDYTTPSMKSWEGVNTEYPITNITEDIASHSVAFDIAGGDGAPKNLIVKETHADSLTITWSNTDNRVVMLVYNTTNTFGIPSDRSYSAGDAVEGGGNVLYVGTTSSFKHLELTPGTMHYYRLYTRYSNKYAWMNPLQVKGYTYNNGIKEFPYSEDFESGQFAEGWTVPSYTVYGNTIFPWTVGKTWDCDMSTSAVFYFNPYSVPNPSSKCIQDLVMPMIDFTGHEKARLEFDCRNIIKQLTVWYRPSQDENWTWLAEIPSHDDPTNPFVAWTPDSASSMQEHVVLELPNLSQNYQIKFRATDYVTSIKTSSNSATLYHNMYNKATIDNIYIIIDNDVLPKQPVIGDVNDDGEVDSGDYIGIKNLILEVNTDGLSSDAADVNEDGNIDAGDCVGIVNYVLYDSFIKYIMARSASAPEETAVSISDISIAPCETKTMALVLETNTSDFTALQFDILLPDGLNIDRVRWDETRTDDNRHSLRMAKQPDGRIRIIGTSSENKTFFGSAGDIILFTLTASESLSANSELRVENIRLARTNTHVVRINDICANIFNGEITSISACDNSVSNSSIFTITGQKARSMGNGIYIINGNKIIR